MSTTRKPALIEAVMFFSERGICSEMLYPEFEALLDGMVSHPEYIDETVEAVFLQINARLHVRAAVFFTIDFDQNGYINRLWNLPLRSLAEKAGRGPDMGGGPIRLVCLGFNQTPEYRPLFWKPGQRGGRSDLMHVKEAVTRNTLGILGEDEEALAVIATERLQIAAEEGWYGKNTDPLIERPEPEPAPPPSPPVDDETPKLKQQLKAFALQVAELQAQLREQEENQQRALAAMQSRHAEHLGVVQGELLDVKKELEQQQKLNLSLKRDLARFQSRNTGDPG